MAEKLIPIYIMGKKYEVPSSLTIMRAMEWAGYKLIRGAGCRSGFCGACATVYRLKGDYHLRIGLACQTVVEPEMYLAQIPFFPAEKAIYDIEELKPTPAQLFQIYPEILRCLSCGTCTKACPQEIEVMDYMADAMKGDIASVARKSFDCIMCGLCAARCPAEEAQHNVALLCRRLYGKYLAPKSQHLRERIEEIEAGRFDQELARLRRMSREELRQRYKERDIEPD